jgi:methylase of polypeptide subunit release factors
MNASYKNKIPVGPLPHRILSGHLADLSPVVNKRLLEIGGGVGLVSIVAATFGHKITMTEWDPDALNFARANAFSNPILTSPSPQKSCALKPRPFALSC